jgi:hypothetical protein
MSAEKWSNETMDSSHKRFEFVRAGLVIVSSLMLISIATAQEQAGTSYEL